jgi:uncharacterized membrane protein YjjP (DUF1212 family)
MEKEDKIIQDFLFKALKEKAPAGFTGQVMEAVEVEKVHKQPVQSDWLYWLVIAGSLMLAVGVLLIIDPLFLDHYWKLFTGFLTGFSRQITVFPKTILKFDGYQLITGTFLIMFILLLFDRVFWSKQKHPNVFLWI